MLTTARTLALIVAACLGASAMTDQAARIPPFDSAQGKPRTAADDGFTDTPMLPGLPWHVHDPARPKPPIVTPGAVPGAPPSDAIVLFNGRDLSQWAQRDRNGAPIAPSWNVRDGYFETGKGSLHTRASF